MQNALPPLVFPLLPIAIFIYLGTCAVIVLSVYE
jgi:hypothetical protein